MAIQEMDLEIKHRSGRSNAGADALSRSPVTVNAVATDSNPPADDTPESDATDDGDSNADVFPFILSEASQQKLRELSTLQKTCPELNSVFIPSR